MPTEYLIAPGQETAAYNPARDLANIWPAMVRKVVTVLDRAVTGTMTEIDPIRELEWCGVALGSREDYTKVLEAVVQAIRLAESADKPRGTVDYLREAGFFDLPGNTRTAVLLAMGQVLLGSVLRLAGTALTDESRRLFRLTDVQDLTDGSPEPRESHGPTEIADGPSVEESPIRPEALRG
jgi:hypothetical protein